MTTKNTQTHTCPCDPQNSYQLCCQPLHLNEAVAKSPEQLMRSRYSAFVKQEYEYLIATHHPRYLNGLTAKDLAHGTPQQWIGLQIIAAPTQQSNQGQVTFKAWYKTADSSKARFDAIFECSDFVLENGFWFYTQGVQFDCPMPERNQHCICQSGKKYKKCCLATL